MVGGSAEFFASGLRLRLVLQTSGITVVRLGTHTLALSSFYAYRPFLNPFQSLEVFFGLQYYAVLTNWVVSKRCALDACLLRERQSRDARMTRQKYYV